MRNEDLKLRLIEMNDEELVDRIALWREKRKTYQENNPAPKKRAAKKASNKLIGLLMNLPESEREALIKEFGDAS